MKLTKDAIALIGDKKSKDAKAIRFTLALALNFTEYWVSECIKKNKDNGPLTGLKAVQIIVNATGLTQDQILEEEVTV